MPYETTIAVKVGTGVTRLCQIYCEYCSVREIRIKNRRARVGTGRALIPLIARVASMKTYNAHSLAGRRSFLFGLPRLAD